MTRGSTNPGFDQRIADWLEDDPDDAPDIVLATVQAAFPSIPQRRAMRAPWRFRYMTSTSRLVAAAIAVAVVAVGGAFILNGGRQSIGAASARPSSSPPHPTITSSDVGKALQAGTYRIDGFAAPLQVTLPADWITTEFTHNSIAFASGSTASANVYLAVLEKVYSDPCQAAGGPAVIGPSVDALVAALSSMRGFEVTDVRDTTVGGATGKELKITNSIDVLEAKCSGEMLPIGTYDKNGEDVDIAMFGGESDVFWVLDASGTRIFMAVTEAFVRATQPVRDSLSFG